MQWDADRWYTLSFTWTPTRAAWSLDGTAVKELKYPSKDVTFRYLHINNTRYEDMAGSEGLTLRNVRIANRADLAGVK